MSWEELVPFLGSEILDLIDQHSEHASHEEKARLIERAAQAAIATLEVRAGAQAALEERWKSGRPNR